MTFSNKSHQVDLYTIQNYLQNCVNILLVILSLYSRSCTKSTLRCRPFDRDKLLYLFVAFVLQAETRFLLSKPTCFIIIGKPGAGKTALARRLSQEWKCILVNGKRNYYTFNTKHKSYTLDLAFVKAFLIAGKKDRNRQTVLQ